MQLVTTITPKYQVHIPVAIRKQIGLKKHGPARISVDKKRLIIEPIDDNFLSLGGSFAVKKPIAAEKIRDYIDYSDDKK